MTFSAPGSSLRRAHPSARNSDLPIQSLSLMLWRGRWIILASSALMLVAGFWQVQRTGTVYRASSRLAIGGFGSGGAAAELLGISNSRNRVNTQAEMLLSTRVLSEVVGTDVAEGSILGEQRNKIGWLKSELRVRVGKNDDVVTISLESPHVAEACALVNSVVDSFRSYHLSKQNQNVRQFLVQFRNERKEHADQLKKELETRTQFIQRNGIGLDPDGSAHFETERLQSLELALAAAETHSVAARNACELAELHRDSPELLREILQLSSGLGGAQLSSSDIKLNELVRNAAAVGERLRQIPVRRAQLLQDRTADHPSIVELDANAVALQSRAVQLDTEIEEFERSVQGRQEAFATQYLEHLLKEAEQATNRVEVLREQVAQQQTHALDLANKREEYREIQTRVELERSTISSITADINELNLADIGEDEENSLVIDVLDPASIDTAVITTSRGGTFTFFVLLGLVAGCGISWLRDHLDQRLRSEADVTMALGVAPLAIMPLGKEAAATNMVEEWSSDPIRAEAARSLRTAVYFGLPKGQGRIIHITSPGQRDGKSTITAQLGIAMACTGQRTLIIDGDMRSPSQAKMFGLEDSTGLSTALTSGSAPEEFVQDTSVDNLCLLACGPIPAHPVEMLNGQTFGALLERLAESYDRILVDSPPILAVADSRVIATKCDVSLMVLRADKSTRKHSVAAMDSLASVGAGILGVILNAIPSGNGFGYGYGYGYGYGETPKHQPELSKVA